MPFANYEEFKELFVRNDGQRKNKVLLAYLKTNELRKYIRGCTRFSEEGKQSLLEIHDMATLFEMVNRVVSRQSFRDHRWNVRIMDTGYGSDDYKTDGQDGICVDGDISAYRYVNVKADRVYKMKIGKMYKHLILNSEFGRLLPEQVVLWMCEEMARRWEAWAKAKLPSDDLTLHVDDNFSGIYNSAGECVGNFGSCMAGHGQWKFYRDAVKAKAAYLTNADGGIVARCILWTEVHDYNSGEVFRLAERQYASEGNELLKRTLVQKLIDGGYIDGYKQVGAGCGEGRAFVTNSGESMSSRNLWVECDLDCGDILSYQDSFKSYDMDERRADNYGYGEYDLEKTNYRFEESGNWSEYHDHYIPEEDSTYVETRDDWFYDTEVVHAYVYCSRDGGFYEQYCFQDDVIEIDGDYYYAGDGAEEPERWGICTCPQCGEYFVPDRGHARYSECTEEDYCCSHCMNDAENEWKEDHGWVFSEYDDEWFEDEDEVGVYFVGFFCGRWETETISVDSLIRGERSGRIVKINDDYYSPAAAKQYIDMTPMVVNEPNPCFAI